MPQLKRAFFAAHPLDGLLLSLSLGYAAVRRFQAGARNEPTAVKMPSKTMKHGDLFFFSPTMWMCFFLFCSKGGKWTTFNRGDGKDGSKRAF